MINDDSGRRSRKDKKREISGRTRLVVIPFVGERIKDGLSMKIVNNQIVFNWYENNKVVNGMIFNDVREEYLKDLIKLVSKIKQNINVGSILEKLTIDY